MNIYEGGFKSCLVYEGGLVQLVVLFRRQYCTWARPFYVMKAEKSLLRGIFMEMEKQRLMLENYLDVKVLLVIEEEGISNLTFSLSVL